MKQLCEAFEIKKGFICDYKGRQNSVENAQDDIQSDSYKQYVYRTIDFMNDEFNDNNNEILCPPITKKKNKLQMKS